MQHHPAPGPAPDGIARRMRVEDRLPALEVSERNSRPGPAVHPQHRPADHTEQNLVDRHIYRGAMRLDILEKRNLRQPGAHESSVENHRLNGSSLSCKRLSGISKLFAIFSG